MTTQELREEFRKEFELDIHDTSIDTVTDYWLAILAQRDRERNEEVFKILSKKADEYNKEDTVLICAVIVNLIGDLRESLALLDLPK